MSLLLSTALTILCSLSSALFYTRNATTLEKSCNRIMEPIEICRFKKKNMWGVPRGVVDQ